MKKNLLLLFVALFLFSCAKDEPEGKDIFVGSYSGTMDELKCAIPQDVLSTVSMNVVVTSVNDSLLNVSMKNTSGEFLNFNGKIVNDSLFSIIEFDENGVTYVGNGLKTDKFKLFIGTGCKFFGEVAPTYIFKEN